MKVASLITLTATSLVSAGKFIPLSEKSTNVVQGAYIIDEDGIDHTKAVFYVFNGASYDVKSGHNGEDLAMIPGVKRVWPVKIISVGKSKVLKNKIPTSGELYGPHTMTGVDYVHKTLNYTSKRIKVGILDTALTIPSPPSADALAKDGASGTDGTLSAIMSNPKQKFDPRDTCHGNGTHVAGIIGADARKVGAPHSFVGVAPEVTFGAYRVFDCDGYESSLPLAETALKKIIGGIGCLIDQCQNVIKVKTSISPEHIQLLDTVHFASKSVDVKINNLGKKTTT
ncbi:hypothetical protein CPB97_000364 [Podila verticillata]|nr:hypothetical protein CPB97_000364 [Podila verticillata]